MNASPSTFTMPRLPTFPEDGGSRFGRPESDIERTPLEIVPLLLMLLELREPAPPPPQREDIVFVVLASLPTVEDAPQGGEPLSPPKPGPDPASDEYGPHVSENLRVGTIVSPPEPLVLPASFSGQSGSSVVSVSTSPSVSMPSKSSIPPPPLPAPSPGAPHPPTPAAPLPPPKPLFRRPSGAAAAAAAVAAATSTLSPAFMALPRCPFLFSARKEKLRMPLTCRSLKVSPLT